jgi:hypothetical protein
MKVPSALAGVVLLGCVGIPMAASAQTGVTRAAPQASSDTGGLPQVERPSGPHGIGRVGYHWTDSKRPDRFATEAQTHRELMVYKLQRHTALFCRYARISGNRRRAAQSRSNQVFRSGISG